MILPYPFYNSIFIVIVAALFIWCMFRRTIFASSFIGQASQFWIKVKNTCSGIHYSIFFFKTLYLFLNLYISCSGIFVGIIFVVLLPSGCKLYFMPVFPDSLLRICTQQVFCKESGGPTLRSLLTLFLYSCLLCTLCM